MDHNFRVHSRSTTFILVISFLVIVVSMAIMILFSGNKTDQFSVDPSYDENTSIVSSQKAENDYSSSVSSGDEDKNANAGQNDVSDTEPEHGWVINNYGYTYLYGDCGYQQFNYKQTALDRYVNSINAFSDALPEKTEYYNIIVPVSSTFADIPSEIYKEDNFYNLSQSAFVSTVSSKTNEGVRNVSIVKLLETAYDDGEYVYFRTDNNWTFLGAYKAYSAYCESAGITPYSLDRFISRDKGDFLGSFYRATSSEAMYVNPDKFICYNTIPEISTVMTVFRNETVFSDYMLCENETTVKNRFDTILGINAGRYEICSNAQGGSLLIIGDSSAAPIIPFLASHYTKIDYINPLEFKTDLGSFLKSREYDQVISMCYSTNAVMGNYIPALNVFTGAIENE